MRIKRLHSWDLSPKEAIALQRELATRVDTRTPLRKYELVAGVDVSCNRFSNILYAGVVVLRADDLSIVETQGVVVETKFPYIPGLLSFREAPALLEALGRLRRRPDLLVVDGHGIAHPRRLGIAAHIGLWVDIPTVGCAKSRLTGMYSAVGENPGATRALSDKDDIIGMAVRTRRRANPLFVSTGHRIDLAGAVRLVQRMGRGYRLPEPTRQAHLLVNSLRRQNQAFP